MKKFAYFSIITVTLFCGSFSVQGQRYRRDKKEWKERNRYDRYDKFERREELRHIENWRYYPLRGQVFHHIPGSLIQIQFGGNPYYFSGGLFYRPFDGYYKVVYPPLGIRISVLPFGYWPLRWGGYPYFYFNGIFYKQKNNGYEVVTAPVGAEIPSIPRDSKVVVIDGEKFYEYNGTYFKEFIKPNGEIWYTVEGKHGVLNTDKGVNNDTNNQSIIATPPSSTKPNIGDIVNELPENCKAIVISNKKYYVTNDNVYYEEMIDGNSLKYKVVGK